MNHQSQLWNELHDLFDTDDGSLPEIWLTHLNGAQVEHVDLFLLSLGKEVSAQGTTFWDKHLQQARAIDSVENAATLVVQGRAEPFHVLIGGLTLHGTTIPDLGVYIWEDCIYLDYRMGANWRPAELGALFECLRSIKNLAPEMNVTLQEGVIEKVQKRFQRAWQQYLNNDAA